MQRDLSNLNLNDNWTSPSLDPMSDDILLQRKAYNEAPYEPFANNPAQKYKAINQRNRPPNFEGFNLFFYSFIIYIDILPPQR